MTTLVATRQGVYSDSRCSFGPSLFHSKKLFQIEGSVYAISGDIPDCLKFLEWVVEKDTNDTPEFSKEDSFDVLEVSPEGIFLWDGALCRMEVLDPFIAAGSGHMAAMAALHLGSSPEVAIETACKVDPASGGPLQVLHLPHPNPQCQPPTRPHKRSK